MSEQKSKYRIVDNNDQNAKKNSSNTLKQNTRMYMSKVWSNLKSKRNNKNTSSTIKGHSGRDLDFLK